MLAVQSVNRRERESERWVCGDRVDGAWASVCGGVGGAWASVCDRGISDRKSGKWASVCGSDKRSDRRRSDRGRSGAGIAFMRG